MAAFAAAVVLSAGSVGAVPVTAADPEPASRHGVQEWGVKLGYGTSQRGQVEIMPVYGQVGWSMPDVIDLPLRRHGVDMKYILEGWAAGIHTPRSDAFEFGINPIEFKFAYDVGQQFVPFFQGGVGVMYTSLQDGLKLGGPFEFDEVVGAGLDLFCNDNFALSVSYRYRHMSNAGLGDDNRGLDTQYVLLGFDFHPQR
ncbi:MAG TPA: acyloxyacyl hydrolase [Candidatus Binatia bacterium]|nr:acyloxyacyl hydrolase [Candidatus Binatia bacterium]